MSDCSTEAMVPKEKPYRYAVPCDIDGRVLNLRLNWMPEKITIKGSELPLEQHYQNLEQVAREMLDYFATMTASIVALGNARGNGKEIIIDAAERNICAYVRFSDQLEALGVSVYG